MFSYKTVASWYYLCPEQTQKQDPRVISVEEWGWGRTFLSIFSNVHRPYCLYNKNNSFPHEWVSLKCHFQIPSGFSRLSQVPAEGVRRPIIRDRGTDSSVPGFDARYASPKRKAALRWACRNVRWVTRPRVKRLCDPHASDRGDSSAAWLLPLNPVTLDRHFLEPQRPVKPWGCGLRAADLGPRPRADSMH